MDNRNSPESITKVNVPGENGRPNETTSSYVSDPPEKLTMKCEFADTILPIVLSTINGSVLDDERSGSAMNSESTERDRPDTGQAQPTPDERFDPEQKRTMRIVGWILIGLGLFAVIWIFGLVLIPIGVVLVILGWEKNDGNKSRGKSSGHTDTYIDVVYLKNGSIIRGTIIEQVPGVSLKIQTADGSVFFYKMEEIEKITKEKANN